MSSIDYDSRIEAVQTEFEAELGGELETARELELESEPEAEPEPEPELVAEPEPEPGQPKTEQPAESLVAAGNSRSNNEAM